MKFINLSHKPLKIGGIKEGLLKVVVLPDYCFGKGILPVGIVAVYDKKNHVISSDYLGPDVGCGMTLARFKKQPLEDLEDVTNKTAEALINQTKGLGSLGGGNHFVDIYQVKNIEPGLGIDKRDYLTLIHSGSRLRGQEVYEKGIVGAEYLEEYADLINFGSANRKTILGIIEKAAKNKLDIILDQPHNTLELNKNNIIYRKGAVQLKPGKISVIPSSMNGEAILVRGKDKISELENSMCHGTGRKVSRSIAREKQYYLQDLSPRVYIPYFISPENIATELPQCYNKIKDILPAIRDYVDVIGKLSPKSAIML